MDRDGRGEGIDRQRARCTALAESRGWELVQEYTDNDVSASKPRGKGTAWYRMMHDVKSGSIDTVIAVDQDRLLRTLSDLVTLMDMGVKVVTVDGEIDLSTAEGEFRASMGASMARFEVRRKSERQVRANAHRRGLGLPPGGRRAFGYTKLRNGASLDSATRLTADGNTYPDFGHQPTEPEASAVRRGFALLLSGASIQSIAKTWNAEGLTTTTGTPWQPYSVRAVLSNPRYAALVAPPRVSDTTSPGHYLSLDDLAVGSWEPLVSLETWQASRDLLADPVRKSNPGRLPRTLLSGIAWCETCRAPMRAGVTNGIKLYRCSTGIHISRKREDADYFIQHIVLNRLATPDAASALLDRRDDSDTQRLREELRAAQAAERNVLALVSQGLTTLTKASASLRDVRERVAAIETALSEVGKIDVVSELIGAADAAGASAPARWTAVATMWEGMDVERRRAIVAALLDIVMASPGKGSRAPKDAAGRLAHTERTMTLTWR